MEEKDSGLADQPFSDVSELNERRFTRDERQVLHQRDARRAFDQFDLIAVGSVDKDEPASGRTSGRTVGDHDAFALKFGDRLVKVVDFKGQMDEIFLNLYGATRGEAAQLDQFFTIWNFQKRQMRSPRRDLSLHDLEAENAGIEPDGLIHVADPHAGMEKLTYRHRRSTFHFPSEGSRR